MSWSDHARSTIAAVHEAVPAGATLAERTKAVDAAYPFGLRAHHPYKAWLKVRAAYLAQFGYQRRGDRQIRLPLSALERVKAVAK